MASSKRDVINPEAKGLVTYESSIKSGTHGDVYQKQLAQLLLLRLTREERDFSLAYELTSADKFDDVVLYDKTDKQWIFLQSKHADGKESKIDLIGLLPKTNREKGDFSLYKYFCSYMTVRNRFMGKINFVLFTNKRLDEKLSTAEDCFAIQDRGVDEYLRFTSEGASQKLLIPTESTIQSIMEYTNKIFYSLKDAIKQLFTKGLITDQLLKYKAYLKDILEESENCQIRFTDTFNESLIFISEFYKTLQSELQNFTPIDKPVNLDVSKKEYNYTNLPTVNLKQLAGAIENLFRSGIMPVCLKKYEHLLSLILTMHPNGQLTFKDTFNSDVVFKAELYRMLKAELGDMNKKVTTEQKLFDGKDSRSKHHPVLLYAEESDVRKFFTLLTLSVHQPDELEPFIVEELHSLMKMWLRPDVLGKLTEDDDKIRVKNLDDHFEASLKCKKEDSDGTQNLQDHGNTSDKTISLDANTTENELWDISEYRDDRIFQPKKTYEEITDSEFAANLMVKFAQYKCLVLTADPGIGKTKLLQYLALEHQKLKLGTVYLFYLNRLQDSKDVSDNENILNILKPMLSDKNIKLIENALDGKYVDHITILFDGYDEIHNKNIDKINRLLELLFPSKQIQMVISVRNHEKNALQKLFKEHNINARYFSLEPFSSENIIEYLAKSWKEKVESEIDFKFDSYSKFLVDTFYSLCRVPLMVKMMSKIYKQQFETFKKISMTNKEDEKRYLEKEFLEVEHIYEIFIKKCLLVKIEDASHGKVDPNKQNFDGFYLDHQLLAIEFLDVGELKFLLKNPKYIKKWDCIKENLQNRIEKSILLNFVDGRFLFSHHSYAEYFVATFMWDDFIKLKNIVKNVLSRFTGIRRFFIKTIEKNIKLFVSEIAHETSFDSTDVVFWACESNAVELLKYVLSKNRRKILFRPSEAKMLHIAIENGSDKIFSYLIEDCKVHPDKYYGGLAPLHSAIIYGHINLVQLLLRKGADIHIRNTEGWSALHYAIHHKQIEITNFLIDKGTDVNSISKNKWTALHISCNNGDADVTRMLIQKGARIDVSTNEGKTPLDLAAAGGHSEVATILIENLIETFPFSWKIDDVLWKVVIDGHDSLKKMLIREYEKLSALSMNLIDPDIAAWVGIIEKVERLLNDGANVNAARNLERTALLLGASTEDRVFLELLFGKDAGNNAVDTKISTPLHWACHKEVVEKFTRNKAKMNAISHKNSTPLHFACQNGHTNIVEILIEKNANIEALTEENFTPLHLACHNGHIEVVEILLREKANIDALSHENFTPLHFAYESGHKEIVEILTKQKS
ncbi:hypothetical protein RP20_CCG005280 [Aedes albopictus]|nr:hypothetical protein RP20_CCG005280 [Aedes albopictus]